LTIGGLPAIATLKAVSDAFDQRGIDALKLQQPPYNLLGRKIAIGQLEVGRPGKFGQDKAVSKAPLLPVTQVFYRSRPPRLNLNVDNHAQGVAGVMISLGKALPGIAPQARLYSSAAGITRRNGQAEGCAAAQHLALQNGGDLRAINVSFGESLRDDSRAAEAVLDGNALLTQCIDWSARVHDVLYLIAGNQGKGGVPIPSDHYNAMTIASSTRIKGVFTKVDFANLSDPDAAFTKRLVGRETNVGTRRSVSLVAPGSRVFVWTLEGKLTQTSGTSFAAPQVTATVALLQELGDRQLRQKQPRWRVDARRHLVMKAVLMNAADKLQDSGNGLTLDMSRTLLNKQNRTWLASEARRNPDIPLDAQMGAGHLNAYRAYLQFSPGQYAPDQPVAAIAWDYRTVDQPGTYRDYVLAKPLQQGSSVAITLAWDRRVELDDANRNGQYDAGETFRDRGLNNLDLYLMRADDQDSATSVWSSNSSVDSVEHIFQTIPQTGRYKIRVQFRQRQFAGNEVNQPYGLAWWMVPAR
jgi:hypothetical protein